MRTLAFFLVALALVFAQDWRLTKTSSEGLDAKGTWRYTLSPATKEARELWQALLPQYRNHLQAGYRVDLGAYSLHFRGGALWLARACSAPYPACLTPGALPVPQERQNRFLLELAGLLEKALAEAQGTGGRLTLTGLFRVDLGRGQPPPYRAYPSGWKP
jgi:hypothetical protein